MTESELNVVRDMKKRIRDLERHIEDLRLAVQNITPILDGLPKSTEIKSRVETLALKIVECDRELVDLRERLPHEQTRLAELILREVSVPALQGFAVLRYVACVSFKETAHRMHITLRHAFRLNEKFFKCHIAAQSEV